VIGQNTVKRDFAVQRHWHLTGEVIMVIIVQHRVRDFDTWKPLFDEHGDVRRREQAEAFAADPSLKEAMARGGVISEPHMTWADETETVEY
jgi:hypothetical protein